MASAGDQIENPLSGERIVFRRTASETNGQLLELDSFWTRPGRRVPEHIHPSMQESWEVISGAASFRIDGVQRTANVGGTVIAPPGVPHLAWNPGEEVVHVRIQLRPALRWEQFVVRLFELAQVAHAQGREAPDQTALLQLLGKFPSEIASP